MQLSVLEAMLYGRHFQFDLGLVHNAWFAQVRDRVVQEADWYVHSFDALLQARKEVDDNEECLHS